MSENPIIGDPVPKQCCEACICEVIHSSIPPVPDNEL